MAQVVLEHAASLDSLLSETDLDIATLLSAGQQDEIDEISGHRHRVQPLVVRFDESQVSPNSSFQGQIHDLKNDGPQLVYGNVFVHQQREDSVCNNNEQERNDVVELKGSDVGEVDIKYRIQGLRTHEMPVIGVYIDKRIALGFKYRVRLLSRQNRYLFGGAALNLARIGQGYGKRITFTNHHLNVNPNFFWSDTNEAGYAFGIIAVETGNHFTIWDADERIVGHALVLEANQRQLEIGSETVNKTVTKRVVVAMKVQVKFTARRHGMMSLINEETVNVCGLATLERAARSSKAELKCVNNVELPMHGECHFYPGSD